jgi:hypothetical protein
VLEVPTHRGGLAGRHGRRGARRGRVPGANRQHLAARAAHHHSGGADIKWGESLLLVRRSQTRGDEVMEATKTGQRQVIVLPANLVEVLRWHVDHLPEGAMTESDLLFPARRSRAAGASSEPAGFRSRSCLDKPFADVARRIGLGYRVSPKAMRRTFQDLARAANVHDLVTRAISGHATATMQRHYSTVPNADGSDRLGEGYRPRAARPLREQWCSRWCSLNAGSQQSP